MIPDYPDRPWKASRKRKISSKDTPTEPREAAKKQKTFKPAASDVHKEVAELDPS